jgi:hypothetical protein
MDTAGVFHGFASAAGYQRNPMLSRDGRYLAHETYRETASTIRITDLNSHVSNLLDPGMRALVPVWSPDGSQIAFVVEQPGEWVVYRKYMNRSDPPQIMWRSPHYVVLTDWAPSPEALITTERTDYGDYDLQARTMAGIATVLADGPAHQGSGRLSPSADILAFVSLESGEPQVFVQRYPDTGWRCQVSQDGGWQPAWGPKRGELFYLNPRGTVMSATLDLSDPASCPEHPPRPRFSTQIRNPSGARSHFDISRNDGRLLFNVPWFEDDAWLTVIVNWLADVEDSQARS